MFHGHWWALAYSILSGLGLLGIFLLIFPFGSRYFKGLIGRRLVARYGLWRVLSVYGICCFAILPFLLVPHGDWVMRPFIWFIWIRSWDDLIFGRDKPRRFLKAALNKLAEKMKQLKPGLPPIRIPIPIPRGVAAPV